MSIFFVDGNLLADPEWRQTRGGKDYIEFAIAKTYDKDKGYVTFRVHVYGRDGQYLFDRLQKGSKVTVCGRFFVDLYTNKSGEEKFAFKIIAFEVNPRFRLKNVEGGGDGEGNYEPPTQRRQQPQQDHTEPETEDDLPF